MQFLPLLSSQPVRNFQRAAPEKLNRCLHEIVLKLFSTLVFGCNLFIAKHIPLLQADQVE